MCDVLCAMCDVRRATCHVRVAPGSQHVAREKLRRAFFLALVVDRRPGNRFATAVFILLDRESGELVYVNAGHNPPIVWSGATTSFLEPTGTALGMVRRDDVTTPAGSRCRRMAGC